MTEASVEEFEAKKYEFDAEFQTRICGFICRDVPFVQRTLGLIKPDYFENVHEGRLVSLAVKHYETYRTLPDRTTWLNIVNDAFASKIIRDDQKADFKATFSSMAVSSLSNRDYAVDEVEKFSRHQAMALAVLNSIDDLEKGNYEAIQEKIQAAINIGANDELDNYDYYGEIENRTTIRKDKLAGKLPPKGITTGFPKLDKFLYHLGWGRKELSVLMGGAKAGKTMALLGFAKSATEAGFNTLYITLEVDATIIAERIDANISETEMGDLEKRPLDVESKVKHAAKKAGKLMIADYPDGTITASDIERLLARYQSEGTNFDMVVVDYADNMRPKQDTQSVTENSKRVYQELRAIAKINNLAMLTATQTNREGYKSLVAKAEHTAEDFNKVRICDLMISLNASEEEITKGEGRLFFAASRNQEGGFTVKIKQSRSQMRFLTKVLAREAA